MNPYLKQMIELSDIDNDILGFEPEIEKVKSEYNKIGSQKSELLEEVEKLKNSEIDVKSKIATLEKNLERMTSEQDEHNGRVKEVKKDKELVALSMENDLRKEQIQYDNNEIDRFNKILETLAEKLNEKESIFAEFESQLNESEKSMETMLKSIEDNRKKIYSERDNLVSIMDKKIYSFYGKIRKWAKETSTVPVRDGACYGCYIKLNDQTFLEVLKSDDIITCPNCGRLLYIEPEEAVDNQ